MNSHGSSSHDGASAVMVVGGGVAGVQAALDLSALDFKVFLVEKNAAISFAEALLNLPIRWTRRSGTSVSIPRPRAASSSRPQGKRPKHWSPLCAGGKWQRRPSSAK